MCLRQQSTEIEPRDSNSAARSHQLCCRRRQSPSHVGRTRRVALAGVRCNRSVWKMLLILLITNTKTNRFDCLDNCLHKLKLILHNGQIAFILLFLVFLVNAINWRVTHRIVDMITVPAQLYHHWVKVEFENKVKQFTLGRCIIQRMLARVNVGLLAAQYLRLGY